ncbi:---NA--- [Paramuricea clavata]|uniref:---NA n=1 Tax=Paramuricea clavata TaxID=317549 RepID=A0A6S7I5Y7_PARCT|nr:---NA--- [Paramuricea clavata]
MLMPIYFCSVIPQHLLPSLLHNLYVSSPNEDKQEFEEHCETCTSNVDTIQDCTSIALLVIQGLERLQHCQEKVTVLLLTKLLMGSPTIELKALASDKAAEFDLVKDYFKTKTGRRDLQALIYHLIITGMVSEVPVGTPENPSIVIKTGNVQNLQSGSEKCYFHTCTTIFNW